MPHLLVAGTTGSGKSVAINTMILSLLYRFTPEECRLIMVDPKMLELSVYDGIPHLLTPVVTDPKKAIIALRWAVREMEDRYKKMAKLGVRNIDGFNARVSEAKARGEVITRTVQTGFDKETGELTYTEEVMDLTSLPYIVVIVDEMADLMMVAGKEIEGAIQRLAQMARAAGIHVILATQRPSVDVITGTIKANFPTRISFQVTSKIDSRTILGEMGAEQLLGQGDMLYMAGGGRIARVHGPFCLGRRRSSGSWRISSARPSPSIVEAVTAEDEEERGAGGDAGLRRERDGSGIGRAVRPGGLHRAAAQEGVDLLHPAPPADRLQPRRLDHGADGEGGHRRARPTTPASARSSSERVEQTRTETGSRPDWHTRTSIVSASSSRCSLPVSSHLLTRPPGATVAPGGFRFRACSQRNVWRLMGQCSLRGGTEAGIGVASIAIQGEAEMLAQRPDGVLLVRVGILVLRSDNDDPEG